MRSARKFSFMGAAATAAILVIVVVGYFIGRSGDGPKSGVGARTSKANAQGASTGPPGGASRDPLAVDSVELSDSQLASVKVEPIGEREFPVEKESVGSIDFNEELTVQVFTPYPGR